MNDFYIITAKDWFLYDNGIRHERVSDSAT